MDKKIKILEPHLDAGLRAYALEGEMNDEVLLKMKFFFLSDKEWDVLLQEHDWEPRVRGAYISPNVYIKGSARKDPDYRYLLLHELGHAICCMLDNEVPNSIMNSYSKNWIN